MTENFEKKTTMVLADHSKKLNDHDKSFDKIEAKLNDHDKKFARVFDKFIELENKIDGVESNLGAKIDQYQDRILSAINSFVKKTTDVETELLSTRVTLDRHEEDIVHIKKKLKVA